MLVSNSSLASRSISIPALGLFALVLFALTPAAVRADTAIALDLEGVVPIDIDNIDTGPAWAIRLGEQLHLPLITLTPELGFHHASFSDGPTLYRGIAGVRLGVGEVFRFGVFAHVGYGHLDYEVGVLDLSYNAFTFDGGIFLDLTILPLLDIGVHVAYGQFHRDSDVATSDPYQWVAFGAHVALII